MAALKAYSVECGAGDLFISPCPLQRVAGKQAAPEPAQCQPALCALQDCALVPGGLLVKLTGWMVHWSTQWPLHGQWPLQTSTGMQLLH